MPIVINHSPVAAVASLATKAGQEDRARYQDQQRLQQQQMRAQQQAGQEASRFRNLQEMRMTRALEHQIESQQAQQQLQENQFKFRQRVAELEAKGKKDEAQRLQQRAAEEAKQAAAAEAAELTAKRQVIGQLAESDARFGQIAPALEKMPVNQLVGMLSKVMSADPSDPAQRAEVGRVASNLARMSRQNELNVTEQRIDDVDDEIKMLSGGRMAEAISLDDDKMANAFTESYPELLQLRSLRRTLIAKRDRMQHEELFRNPTGEPVSIVDADQDNDTDRLGDILNYMQKQARRSGERVTVHRVQQTLGSLGWMRLNEDQVERLREMLEAADAAAMAPPERSRVAQGVGRAAADKFMAEQTGEKPDATSDLAGVPDTATVFDDAARRLAGQDVIEDTSSVPSAGGRPFVVQDGARATLEGAMIVAPAEPAGGTTAAADRKAEQPTRIAQDSVREAFRLRREGKDDEAMLLFRQAAETGDPRGMRALGAVLYDDGEHEEGVAWMKKAIEAGDTDAMVVFGARRPVGDDESADPRARRVADDAHARKWYTKAAEKGNTDAMIMLGQLSQNETLPAYTRRNDKEAYGWYRKAAEAGDADAMETVGFFHEQGRGGVTKDPYEARRWYLRSIEAGNRKWGEQRLKALERRLANEAEREGDTE